MTTQQFKTNIKCGGCIAAVKPHLDNAEGIQNWEVDLQSPDRVLTVNTEKSASEVASLIKEAGYDATPIS
jgi:copper chaperone